MPGVQDGTSWPLACSARARVLERYQDVSELAYHLPDRPRAFCVCLSGRHNQYELWPGYATVAARGDNLVLALDESPDVPADVTALTPYFAHMNRGELAPLLRGADTVEVRRVWVFSGYLGGWPPRSAP